MARDTAVVALATLLLSALLTGALRRLAASHGTIDLPNQRSSHSVPTPRGGGAAIVLSVLAALTSLLLLNRLPAAVFAALVGGGAAVAMVGILDDRRPLPPTVRLIVHFGAALWALVWVGGLPPLRVGEHILVFGPAGYVVGALGIVWVINLFNFMDGIDGIAASEAVFVSWAGALLALTSEMTTGVPAAAIVFGAACVGFLAWNWPPAKIFMGDVGSGFLGYCIAVLAIAAARDNPVALLIWLILGGVFFVDATVTFLRRLGRGERVYEAHRTHAYQWLSRRWGSHKRVTLVTLAINLCWLLPVAWYANAHPVYAPHALIIVLASLTVPALLAGAGRREPRPPEGASVHTD